MLSPATSEAVVSWWLGDPPQTPLPRAALVRAALFRHLLGMREASSRWFHPPPPALPPLSLGPSLQGAGVLVYEG